MPGADDLIGDQQGGGTGESMYGDLALTATVKSIKTSMTIITALSSEVTI